MIGTDRGTIARAVCTVVVGVALFAWGLQGGRGPLVLGPGVFMILGGLLALYGFLVVVVATWTRAGLRLSKAEWERWGPTLEASRAELLERIRAGDKVGAVADDLLASEGIPRDVTLRYVIHVGKGG